MTDNFFYIFYSIILGTLLYFAHRAGKKVNSMSTRMSKNNNKEIILKETTYLGPGKAIHLVEINGQKHAIASMKDSIQYLTKVTGTEQQMEEVQDESK